MDLERIEALIETIEHAQVTELAIRGDGSAVVVRKSRKSNGCAPKLICASPKAAMSPGAENYALAKTPPGITITAPMVGIFHSLDGIKEKGVHVKKGQVVGAIESMKLMNEIASNADGEVEEILVEDGMPVEYGQALFRLSNE